MFVNERRAASVQLRITRFSESEVRSNSGQCILLTVEVWVLVLESSVTPRIRLITDIMSYTAYTHVKLAMQLITGGFSKCDVITY